MRVFKRGTSGRAVLCGSRLVFGVSARYGVTARVALLAAVVEGDCVAVIGLGAHRQAARGAVASAVIGSIFVAAIGVGPGVAGGTSRGAGGAIISFGGDE